MGNGDVRNAIRRLGKQMAAELKDEEIFLSPEFKSYCNNLANFILRKHKLYALNVQYDPTPQAPVAYTDGKNIVLNTGNELAARPTLLEGRFKVNLGILFHECAHKLFMDFDTDKKGMDTITGGKLFGKFNIPAGSDLEGYKIELEEKLNEGYGNAIAAIYHRIFNIINDGHDEHTMKKCFPGVVAQCIDAAGKVQVETTPSLESLVANGAQALSIYYCLMLQYAKFGYCNLGEENEQTSPYTDWFARMEPVIDEALEEDNYKARWTHINTLILLLWPTLRDLLENSQDNDSSNGQAGGQGSGSSSGNSSGSSGGSSGNSSGDDNGSSDGDDSDGNGNSGGNSSGNSPLTDEQLRQLIQSIADEADKQNGAAPAPQGSGEGVDPSQIAAAQSGASGDAADALAGMMAAIGKGKAEGQIQQELDKAQMDAIRNANVPLIHQKIRTNVVWHHDEDVQAYNEMYKDVEPYVRSLIQEITALLREHNEEAVQHHKRFGPIIEPTEAYRPDGAFFAKKKLPEDRPNMAMCILLDESGSMNGRKMDMAKKALVMLERFAAGIGVPLLVAGHHAHYSGTTTLNIYSDFVSARPDKDRYALATIYASGCNRDGLAIRQCADMLAQRPEDIRLMVVISDGAPSDYGYSGKEAKEDIQKTVAEFRRKGLIIYGAAIDDDREVIQSLYGSGFLSITDLKSLPKTMVRLLRQNIV